MKQSMCYDDLGDRMKMYEGQEGERHFIPNLPIIARMDGRAFHTFARDLDKPYDERMVDAITEHDIEGAGSWVVRPAYHAPQPSPAAQGDALDAIAEDQVKGVSRDSRPYTGAVVCAQRP